MLLIEVVTLAIDGESPPTRPYFRVVAARGETIAAEALLQHLQRVDLGRRRARVQLDELPSRRIAGSVLPTASDAVSTVRVEVAPIWSDPASLAQDEARRRRIRRRLGVALRHACFDFTRASTTFTPDHVHSLGRRTLLKSVQRVDQALAEIQDSFDPLLAITPVDADRLYREFRRRGRARQPIFDYPPVPVDVDDMRRRLNGVEIDQVEDPVLAHLLREKRRELDLQLALIDYRDRRQFLGISLALHGAVGQTARDLAEDLLLRLPMRRAAPRAETVSASAFMEIADAELSLYRRASSFELCVRPHPGLPWPYFLARIQGRASRWHADGLRKPESPSVASA